MGIEHGVVRRDPEHIAGFVTDLGQADAGNLTDAIEKLHEVCAAHGCEVLSFIRRSGPDAVFAHVSFPESCYPRTVFVKSCARGSVLNRYIALRRVSEFSAIMHIYGVTRRWLVLEDFKRLATYPRPELSSVAWYLLAVDALLRVQALDVALLTCDGSLPFPREASVPETFYAALCAAREIGSSAPGAWRYYFDVIDQNLDTMFSALTDPDESDLVLVHGEFIFGNIVFRVDGPGWSCRACDWDTARIGSRWTDLEFLTVPQAGFSRSWVYDREVVARYANGLGIWEKSDIDDVRKIYDQYKVFHALRGIWHSRKLMWPEYMGHYIGELLSLQ